MSATEMIARLPPDRLGGARVFRPCTILRPRNVGDVISAEDLWKVRPANLRALIDQRFIVAWPKASDETPPTAPEDAEVLVYNRIGTSTYDVVLGRRLNTRPLPKAEAEKLAEKYRSPVPEAAA